MQSALKISWGNLARSFFLEQRIGREAESLDKLFDRVTSCHVFVEGPGRKHRQGGQYRVKICVVLPGGKEIVASRNPEQDHAHEDPYVAVRDAFSALRRQLLEHARLTRAGAPPEDDRRHGIVARVLTADGYGFIAADDGREIYFHRNAVLDGDFPRLQDGAEVRFSEEDGENGPQASTVRALGFGRRRP